MIKEWDGKRDVVAMARKRVENCFDTAGRIFLSVSGGKDSICLNDVVFGLCKSGQVDKSKLSVEFVDEEAIYPCIERVVKGMRAQWLSIGVPFNWYCVQVKHFNCLNALTNDESFICWDETKRDVWIREKPKFAITSDPFLDERHDTYQEWMKKKTKGGVVITGVRANESVQRRGYMASAKDEASVWPIYDWRDKDVWRYIMERGLDLPEAYMYMYQCGVSKNRMRISQFFSIDTVGSLVKMCEYYPGLFDRICKREPNAYLAMLYYDTEMFRRAKKNDPQPDDAEKADYRQKLKKLLSEKWRFQNKANAIARRECKALIAQFGTILDNDDYRELYEMCLAGDPKRRTGRHCWMRFKRKLVNENDAG